MATGTVTLRDDLAEVIIVPIGGAGIASYDFVTGLAREPVFRPCRDVANAGPFDLACNLLVPATLSLSSAGPGPYVYDAAVTYSLDGHGARRVAVGSRRRVEDGTRHDVVAARLEHQPGADPVEFRQKMRPFLDHAGTVQDWPATGHQPYRIAAGMPVDAEERVSRHRVFLTGCDCQARENIAAPNRAGRLASLSVYLAMTRTGSPSTSKRGCTPRPGSSEAVMQPSARTGAPPAMVTVP